MRTEKLCSASARRLMRTKLLEDQQLRLLVERKVTGPRNTDAQMQKLVQNRQGETRRTRSKKADRKRWRQMSRIWMDRKLRS